MGVMLVGIMSVFKCWLDMCEVVKGCIPEEL